MTRLTQLKAIQEKKGVTLLRTYIFEVETELFMQFMSAFTFANSLPFDAFII